MKRILFICIGLLLGLNVTFAQSYTPPFVTYTPTFNVSSRNLSRIVLDDGTYEARVSYTSSTGHNANYRLEVGIIDDRVVAIYFDNGGAVHAGSNNSGYSYRGGGIEFRTDYDGDIISAYASIQVNYDSGGWQYFEIYF